MHAWYLAQLKPNSLSIATTNLQLQSFETFSPNDEVTRCKLERFIKSTPPLFPGNTFISLNPDAGPWRCVKATRGITRLVSFGTYPTEFPCDIVQGLQKRCDESGKLIQAEPFVPREAVQFVRGPFANYVGKIEKIDRSQRIYLLMERMGAQTRVLGDSDHIKSLQT